MSRYSRAPKHFCKPGTKRQGKVCRVSVSEKLSKTDMKTVDLKKGVRLQEKMVAGKTVHHDKNDPRPHSLHKVTYRHKGKTKTGFFKRVYSSFHDMYQQHLKNKEERSKIHEIEARAAFQKAEAKKAEQLGKAELEKARAERTRARGEASEKIGRGVGSVLESGGKAIASAEVGLGAIVESSRRAPRSSENDRLREEQGGVVPVDDTSEDDEVYK